MRECLRLTGGAAHTAVQLAEGLRVRPERMRANLGLTGSRTSAERIVSVLAPKWGGEAARKLLDDASREAEETGRTLPQVLRDVPELGLDEAELTELCDPAGYTGAAGTLVDRALRDRT